MEFYTSVERMGNAIYYVGYKDGKRISYKDWFNPTLYVPTKDRTPYRTLYGVPVAPIMPGNIKDCREFISTHSVSNYTVHGQTDYAAQYIAEKFPDGCAFDLSVMRVGSIDIEVASDDGFPKPELAEKEVTAITYHDSLDGIYYVYGCGEYTSKESNVKYNRCKDEFELIEKFIRRWESAHPDILTGWNSKYFDLPYLINRTSKLFGEEATKRFSIHRIKPRAIENNYDGLSFEVMGLSQLDYLQLFKKFDTEYGKQETYKLDHIAHVVLDEKKIDYSEYASLNDLYKMNYNKFIEYNIKDTGLVVRMDDKLQFISLALTFAHKANASYDTVLGTVKIWEVFVYNVLKRRNIVVTPREFSSSNYKIEGGYVKEPIKGIHDWVVSFDLNSLYPHLIMQYNMSPETIVAEVLPEITVDNLLENKPVDVPENRCLTASGQLFRTNQRGIFPEILEGIYAERSQVKKNMILLKREVEELEYKNNPTTKKQIQNKKDEITRLNNQQMSLKILMNSFYGAMANQYFQYFDNRIAEAITMSGQLSIRWSAKYIDAYLNKVLGCKKERVVYVDTDSNYVCMSDIVDKFCKGKSMEEKCDFLDNVAQKRIEPVLVKCYEELKEYMHAYQQKMVMKREKISEKVIFTGKKRYVANVLDNEGVRYHKPKLSITGIESVRSSTPQACRTLIVDSLNAIMNQDEETIQRFIQEKKAEFKTLPVEDVAFPRGISDLNKYLENGTYKKGTPIHVRAAIVYNNELKARGLEKRYEAIRSGDKIKFVYLKLPNTVKENVIAFPHIMPREFNLTQYVDYDIQFEKAYLSPIRIILDAIGWNDEMQNTLEDFFV